MAKKADGQVKYHLSYTYKVHPDGVTREEVDEAWGVCDQLVWIPFVTEMPDFIPVVSIDGKTGKDVSNIKLFLSWLTLTRTLCVDPSLPEEIWVILMKTLISVMELAPKHLGKDTSGTSTTSSSVDGAF